MQYNPDTQKLMDIVAAATGKPPRWIRVHLKDGKSFDGFPEFLTWVEDPKDEDHDLDALSFDVRGKSIGRDVAGVEIDHFEILEPR